jgi:alkylation response protein AidB-like acyl-CoA dehydrogenase
VTTVPAGEGGGATGASRSGLDVALGELAEWLHANWDPQLSLREWWQRLGEAGWAQPHWPREWYGRGLSRADALAVSAAIQGFGAVPGPIGFATGMAGPTLLVHGTDEQKRRHLRGMVTGSDGYCQLFSEPNAGSDLAALQTVAVQDGDDWVVNGQKVWTSGGQLANKAMLLARTDVDVPKHAGISYFIIRMDQPGIEVRPLREMTGRRLFNEVFITGARVPVDDLIGGEGMGWTVANTTLAFERALSGGQGATTAARPGPIAGDLDRPADAFVVAPDADAPSVALRLGGWARLAGLAREVGRSSDPVVRQGLARLYTFERLLALTGRRARALQESGGELPGLPNLAKMAQNHAIRLVRDLTFAVLRTAGMLHGYDPRAVAATEEVTGITDVGELIEGALFAQGPPIYGGSDQIQRNIVGERVLGLPREPGTDRGVPFRDLPKN